MRRFPWKHNPGGHWACPVEGEGARAPGAEGLNLQTWLLERKARSTGWKMVNLRRLVYGVPKESWNKKASCIPRSLPRELFRGPSLFFSSAYLTKWDLSNPDIHPSPALLSLGTSPAGMPQQYPPFPITRPVRSSSRASSLVWFVIEVASILSGYLFAFLSGFRNNTLTLGLIIMDELWTRPGAVWGPLLHSARGLGSEIT